MDSTHHLAKITRSSRGCRCPCGRAGGLHRIAPARMLQTPPCGELAQMRVAASQRLHVFLCPLQHLVVFFCCRAAETTFRQKGASVWFCCLFLMLPIRVVIRVLERPKRKVRESPRLYGSCIFPRPKLPLQLLFRRAQVPSPCAAFVAPKSCRQCLRHLAFLPRVPLMSSLRGIILVGSVLSAADWPASGWGSHQQLLLTAGWRLKRVWLCFPFLLEPRPFDVIPLPSAELFCLPRVVCCWRSLTAASCRFCS